MIFATIQLPVRYHPRLISWGSAMSFGCTSYDSVTVSVIEDNQEFAGPDRTICEGSSIQLIAAYGNQSLFGKATMA